MDMPGFKYGNAHFNTGVWRSIKRIFLVWPGYILGVFPYNVCTADVFRENNKIKLILAKSDWTVASEKETRAIKTSQYMPINVIWPVIKLGWDIVHKYQVTKFNEEWINAIWPREWTLFWNA